MTRLLSLGIRIAFCCIIYHACQLTAIAGRNPASNFISNYDLRIKVLPDLARMEVTGTWRVHSTVPGASTIEFYLSQKMKNFKIGFLKPTPTSMDFSISSVVEGGDTKWTIKSKRPFKSGRDLVLSFSYISDSTAAPQFKIGPENSFAGSGGELWYPQRSFANRETGILRFYVPQGETVHSNGILLSGPSEQAKGTFVFKVNTPSKFGFASGRYHVYRRNGKVPFSLSLLRKRENAPTILESCANTLDLLTSLFGPFPYQQFSIAEVDFDSAVLGTGEYGFILADTSVFEKPHNLAYWAHELGHQWWGNLIKTKSKTNGQMLLSEGIAQFGALQAIEYLEGIDAARQFRLEGYKNFNKNQSATGYFQLAKAGTEFPLAEHLPQNQTEILLMHRLANSKGFILLDMLSRNLGRKKLASILKGFVKQNSNQQVSWHDFQKYIEAHSQQDIRWFFEQWFDRIGAPDYKVFWKQDSKLIEGGIIQSRPFFRTKIEVEIRGEGKSLLKTLEIDGEQVLFSLAIPFKADSVTLDPNYKVLRWLPEFR